jgi:hypothetical protein
VYDVVFIRIGAGLSALQPLFLRLIATLDVLIGVKLKSAGKTESPCSGHRHVNTARLIHRQQDWSKREGRRQSTDENRDLLVLSV